jgi:ComF family protein
VTDQCSSDCGGTPFARVLRRLAREAGALLPQVCALCGEPGHAVVCPPCTAALPQCGAHCPVCALPGAPETPCGACQRQPQAYDRTVAPFQYSYPVDRLIQALKYRGRLALAPFFAAAIGHGIAAAGVDVVLPVPLSPGRLRERGFNQALEIARVIARQRSLHLDRRLLTRRRETGAQAALSIDERRENVRGAFHAGADLRGLRVAVVDDVMTTGATLAEIARVLKESGAARVENWVVARAVGG